MSGGALMAGITAWIAGMRRLLVKAYCPERRLSRSGGADRARGSEDLRRTSASEHAGSACRRRAIPMMWRALLPVAFALAGPSARPALAQQKSVTQPAGPARTDGYSVLSRRCLSCHSGAKPAGGLDLATRAGLVKGGASGPALAASSEQSLLLKAVRYAGPQMPPSGRLAQSEIDTMARWIKEGAAYPAGANPAEPTGHLVPPAVTPETMRFWSFQPVRRSKTPAVKDRAWARNPIDAFVLSRLEAGHLAPNGPASRAALIRRASYDLTGLPPTPEAVQAFVADRSPDAYEKVIDRLLASPQYGEKWGRHWLDLVHFAETNSYERDGVKPNAWRYRDYVIDSLNADKPYDQFIREQLAGDELPGRTPEMLIATGYYRLGIWDDEPVDREQAYYDDVDDIVRTTAETFLGLTVGCARCHDHKIDPIPQKDYYSFVSFFAGVNRYGPQCQRPIAPAAEVRKGQGEVAAHGALVQANAAEIAAIESKVAADFSPVEREEFRTDASRIPIVKKRVGRLLTAPEFDRYLALKRTERDLRVFRPGALDTALCVTEDPKPRVTHVLMRGNAHAEGDVVQPAFLSVLSPPQPEIAPAAESCGRRIALAKWIASPANPLTARVMANRLWQYHFGRGIVRTSSNFGFQGSAPTHPELLDWLASELVANHWRLKPLHRMIMLSSTYRMSSAVNSAALERDPENGLMWRFDMRRLEAEEIRDSILAVNGSLNLQRGGPGVFTEIPAVVLAGQSRPGDGWGKSPEDQRNRRSVYIHVKRSLITPMIAGFDGPETDFTCPVRFATTQPTQALSLMNSEFINAEARKFAAYLRKTAGQDAESQVREALRRVMQREPNSTEVARGVSLIHGLEQSDHVAPDAALAAFCVVAYNLNEFVYVE